jgi:hypothetical protein
VEVTVNFAEYDFSFIEHKSKLRAPWIWKQIVVEQGY